MIRSSILRLLVLGIIGSILALNTIPFNYGAYDQMWVYVTQQRWHPTLLRAIAYAPLAISVVGIAISAYVLVSVSAMLGWARVSRPPASRLDAALCIVFTRRAYDHVFGQIITDMREEYLEALATGHRWHASWIHGRVYIILTATIAVWIPTALSKRIVAIWKAF